MKFRKAVLGAGLLAAALPLAAPSGAETDGDVTDFLTTLDSLGIGDLDPGQAVALGQSLCPMLADRGQDTANIAAEVSQSIGRPIGPATLFTGAAISFLCPRAVERVAGELDGTVLDGAAFDGAILGGSPISENLTGDRIGSLTRQVLDNLGL